MYEFRVKGTYHEEGRRRVSCNIKVGDKLIYKRHPENSHDNNAIGIYNDFSMLGWVPAEYAREIAPKIDRDKNQYVITAKHVIPAEGYCSIFVDMEESSLNNNVAQAKSMGKSICVCANCGMLLLNKTYYFQEEAFYCSLKCYEELNSFAQTKEGFLGEDTPAQDNPHLISSFRKSEMERGQKISVKQISERCEATLEKVLDILRTLYVDVNDENDLIPIQIAFLVCIKLGAKIKDLKL